MKKAYVFPGQGAQAPGMGQDLFESHRAMFEQADAVAEQLQILFGPLASHLRSTQLFVQRGVVVLLVRGQVHLIELLVVHFLVLVLVGAGLVIGVVLVGIVVAIITVVVLVAHVGSK